VFDIRNFSIFLHRKERFEMEQHPQKTDRRVLYTKMFLRESLLALMREKPVSKITPTELCRHADVNRNTFYTHYSSPEELLASIEEELFETIRGPIEQLATGRGVSQLIAEICQAIAKNFDLCQILLSENGDPRFLERLVSLAHDQTLQNWQESGIRADAALQEALYTYSVNGSVAVIREWVREGMPQPPLVVADQLQRMTAQGLSGFLLSA
jgi:AcrR family transcriptional regulator